MSDDSTGDPVILVLASASPARLATLRAAGIEPYTGPSPVLVFLASIPASLLGLVVLGIPLALLGIDREGPGIAVLSLAAAFAKSTHTVMSTMKS